MSLFKFNSFSAILLTLTMLLSSMETTTAQTNFTDSIFDRDGKIIKGKSGGSTDSQGCGFISSSPSYEMNLKQRIDYLRFTVKADGGQPTLLVVGPNLEDSFCVLGDELSGLKPEISGVWEAGLYEIYVGDRTGEQHEFVLDISTDN